MSMHHMPFSIPAELSYALVPLNSKQPLITNSFPSDPLSNIPHFPQTQPIFYHHIHKYLRHLRQRHIPIAQLQPRFTLLAHAHPAHIARLTQLISLPSILSKPSGQKRSLVPLLVPHSPALSQPLVSLTLAKQYSKQLRLLYLCCGLGLDLGLTRLTQLFPRTTLTYSPARHRLPTF